MIRVSFFDGRFQGVLQDDGCWTVNGPEPAATVLGAELNRWHGRNSHAGAVGDGLAQADAAAEVWKGCVLDGGRSVNQERPTGVLPEALPGLLPSGPSEGWLGDDPVAVGPGLIRVEFRGGVIATLVDEGWWTARGDDEQLPAVAEHLNLYYGPDCAASRGHLSDPRLAQAEAAAKAWGGTVLDLRRQGRARGARRRVLTHGVV